MTAIEKTPTSNWVDEDGMEFSIFDVCRSKDIKYLRQYLDEGGDPNLVLDPYRTNLLWIACDSMDGNQAEHVKLLLERGADPNEGNPLYIACEWGKIEYVRHLVEHGANPDQPVVIGATALHAACRAGNPDIVSLLLRKGANPNIKGYPNRETPLHVATDYLNYDYDYENEITINLIDCVRILMKHEKTDSNIRNRYGDTPLMCACFKNNPDCVSLLLELGADANIVCSDGTSLLFHVASTGKFECFKLLLEYGANTNVFDNYEYRDSLLSHLCVRGMFWYAKLLLKYGANVNIVSEAGKTPLYMCCSYGEIEGVRFLLENNADPSISSKKGRTPLKTAKHNKNMECVNVLREFGVDN